MSVPKGMLGGILLISSSILLKPGSPPSVANIAVRLAVKVAPSTKHTNHHPPSKILAEVDLGAVSAPVHMYICSYQLNPTTSEIPLILHRLR